MEPISNLLTPFIILRGWTLALTHIPSKTSYFPSKSCSDHENPLIPTLIIQQGITHKHTHTVHILTFHRLVLLWLFQPLTCLFDVSSFVPFYDSCDITFLIFFFTDCTSTGLKYCTKIIFLQKNRQPGCFIIVIFLPVFGVEVRFTHCFIHKSIRIVKFQ